MCLACFHACPCLASWPITSSLPSHSCSITRPSPLVNRVVAASLHFVPEILARLESSYLCHTCECKIRSRNRKGWISYMGVARIFQRGGHTDSYIGYSTNCHLNIVGCLLTKRLTKGGSRAPQDPPLATPLS